MVDTFKVGDKVQPVEFRGAKYRAPVTIVRETKTQWIDDVGNRWRKSDGYLTPAYIDTHRRIVPITEGR